MGIPGFFGVYLKRKRYKNVLITRVPKIIRNLLFDLNGLIHKSASQVYNYGDDATPEREVEISKLTDADLEQQFLDKIIDNLTLVINIFKPTEVLFIAIDGVALSAKINQQRQRRYKASRFKDTKIRFNSSAITPGTDLMFKIDQTIKDWIEANYQRLPPEVYYSGHLTPSEGETKLFNLLRDGTISKGPTVIYGLDADLIFLSLLSPAKEIYLSRENKDDIVNIDTFREELRRELVTDSAVEDFALMSFLIGNDFLPRQPSANDLLDFYDKMFIAYRTIRSGIVNNGEINWHSFAKFIENLAKNEEQLLEIASAKTTKNPNRILESSFTVQKYADGTTVNKFTYHLYRGHYYVNALYPKGSIEGLSPEVLGFFSPTSQKIEKMCQNYLTTIAWNFRYYTQGPDAVNPEHLYHYNYSPLLSDLSILIKETPGSLGEYKNFEGAIYFTPLHQLLAVIPQNSRDVLPQILLPYLEFESPLYYLFVENFEIDMNGKNEEYAGIAILPSIDVKYIYQNLQIDKNLMEKYFPVEMIHLSQGKMTEYYQSKLAQYQARKNPERGENFRGRGARGNFRGRGSSRGARGNFRGRGTSRGGRGNFRNRSTESAYNV